jgi:hypothetical protein
MTDQHNPGAQTSPDAAPQSGQSVHPKRKRGAQPGNRNAVKYGFYARKSMRRLNYDHYINDPELLITEFEKIKQVMHGMFATITAESSMKDMLFTCRLLFYTTTAFNHLMQAVNHPKFFRDTLVYDWDAIHDILADLNQQNPDPKFPPSPFTPSRRVEG